MTKNLEEIRRIVAAALADAGDGQPFSDDDSLVVSGRLGSLDVVTILTSLEETFGVQIHADDFDPMQFDSVQSIQAMLEQLRS